MERVCDLRPSLGRSPHTPKMSVPLHMVEFVGAHRTGSDSGRGLQMPSRDDLQTAITNNAPLWPWVGGNGFRAIWPPAWMRRCADAAPASWQDDPEVIASLAGMLRRQVRWVRDVQQKVGGRFVAASVTDVLTDTVIEWAHSTFPRRPRQRGRDWDAHGIYKEVGVPIDIDGQIRCRFCDLVVFRPDAPDLVIEIDSLYNRAALRKLAVARDAGAVAVWIRWGAGKVTPPPGIRLIDLTTSTRNLRRAIASPAEPACRFERAEVEISEYSEFEVSSAGVKGRGQRGASQIRYQAAKWLSYEMTKRTSSRGGRNTRGVVVVGHRRLGAEPLPRNPRVAPGERVRYEVIYTAITGNVTPLRPLVCSVDIRPVT